MFFALHSRQQPQRWSKVKAIILLMASTAFFLVVASTQSKGTTGHRRYLRYATTSPLVDTHKSTISTNADIPGASWDNFDRIVCLNVQERPERLEHARGQFQKVGILDKVDFYIAPRQEEGCFKAHWNAIHQAYKDGLDNVLIFEDDIIFSTGWQEVISDMNAFIIEEPDWEHLNVGMYVHYVEESRTNPNIVNGKSAQAHSFAMSRRGMERFLDKFPTPTSSIGLETDTSYMVFLSHTFFHKNYQAITQLQKDFGSDNPWDFIEKVSGMDEQYKFFIQNTLFPEAQKRYGDLVMNEFSHWSWRTRPWIMPNTAAMGKEYPIQVYRDGHEEEFPWRTSLLGAAVTWSVGFHHMLTFPLPDGINRFRMLWYVVQVQMS